MPKLLPEKGSRKKIVSCDFSIKYGPRIKESDALDLEEHMEEAYIRVCIVLPCRLSIEGEKIVVRIVILYKYFVFQSP